MSSITSAAGVGGGSVGASSGFGALDSEEFLNIMFTELQNQDPFEPNDSSALLEQLNSIRSIESDMATHVRNWNRSSFRISSLEQAI